MFKKWKERKHCPHSNLRAIFGDEINARGGYRLECWECGRLLDGPSHLAGIRQIHEVEMR